MCPIRVSRTLDRMPLRNGCRSETAASRPASSSFDPESSTRIPSCEPGRVPYASVLLLVFREAALIGTTGTAMGVAASMALGRLVDGLVFDLKPGDPRVPAAAIALLIVIALAAALAPARRGASIDPMRALRTD